MKNVTLNNGVQMPILGFGVFQIPDEETQTAVEAALAAGYRHLDTAASYGNEEAVGARDQGKRNRPRGTLRHHQALDPAHPTGNVEDDTKPRSKTRCSRLGLDYVDLYLIHQPLGDYYSEWRAMQEINKEGRARAIGYRTSTPTGWWTSSTTTRSSLPSTRSKPTPSTSAPPTRS